MIVLNKFVCYVTVLVLTVIQKIPPVAPQAISVITETLKTVNLGGTVELTCTYDTTTRREDIRIYWLKVKAQGDELILEIPDESTSVVHDPYKGRFKRQGDNNLEINDVVLADAGLYKCNVTTKGVIIQSSSSAVELVVNGTCIPWQMINFNNKI
ncbi:uncharacterized protein LOC117101010 [Anneissia japonica]|uniref:uncharacterized protein LOC117101010 n=1 Tax=Anneissia japonica TaxID=1529436 RepID=UPI0014259E32|nr:uncharacterized protein LOC117101010 [Anneissia japonica]